LPPAEIGTAQQEIPVIISPKQLLVGYITVAATLTGITAGMATFGVAQLDKATALQCRTHDWPVKTHKIHMDWCADNGYVTK